MSCPGVHLSNSSILEHLCYPHPSPSCPLCGVFVKVNAQWGVLWFSLDIRAVVFKLHLRGGPVFHLLTAPMVSLSFSHS